MLRDNGFTVWELLVTSVIVSVVAGIGVPALADLIHDNRRTQYVNSFVHSIHLARTEAMKRGRNVTLCKSASGSQCEAGTTRWSDGWIVFVNLDRDQPPLVDPNEELLYVKPAAELLNITANRNAFSLRPFDKRATNGTLVFCDRRGPDKARAVIVSYTGRPRVSGRSASGAPLICPGLR